MKKKDQNFVQTKVKGQRKGRCSSIAEPVRTCPVTFDTEYQRGLMSWKFFKQMFCSWMLLQVRRSCSLLHFENIWLRSCSFKATLLCYKNMFVQREVEWQQSEKRLFHIQLLLICTSIKQINTTECMKEENKHSLVIQVSPQVRTTVDKN